MAQIDAETTEGQAPGYPTFGSVTITVRPDDMTDYGRALFQEIADNAESAPPEPRAIIRHFAAAMERKLAANDGVKGGWRDQSPFNLLRCLREECDELTESLHTAIWTGWKSTAAIRDEACDVALFALMVADAIGALPPTDERGR